MKRFWIRTLTAALCALIVVLPAMATDILVNNNELALASASPAMETQFDQGPLNCRCDGNFQVGDRVFARVDNPSNATGLPFGSQGWVICGVAGSVDLLVSWDDWTSGHNGDVCACPEADPRITTSSGWYVLCDEIWPLSSVTVDCVCSAEFSTDDRVWATVDNPQGAPGIMAGDTGTVICGASTGFPNLLISWDNWHSGHTGNGACDCIDLTLPERSGWYVDCPDVELLDVSCACFPELKTGDRVTAVVSNPLGAPGIMQGRGGIVVCGVSMFDELVLISWDDWQDGHDGDGICECPVDSLPDSSGWWVECAEVTPSVPVDCLGSTVYMTGDRVRALVDNSNGVPDVFAGHLGTIISATTLENWYLISWDGITSGHNGFGAAECPAGFLDNPSGWYHSANDFAPAGDTIDASLHAEPGFGFAPFTTVFTARLTNFTTENRRAAGKIDVVIANGTLYSNWRSGWTNLTSLEMFSASWITNFPNLPTVIGSNIFTIFAEDVTPAPFNQPPYAPSGDTDSQEEHVVVLD